MKIWCISDTHNKHTMLKKPKADIVIFAGDATVSRDKLINQPELESFFRWFASLPYKYKIYVPGNHDTSYPANLVKAPENVIVLNHNEVVIEGIKIFGSPYTPRFGSGWSYNVDTWDIKRYWDQIPEDTNILVTHGPAKGILDITMDKNTKQFRQCGCSALLETIGNIQPDYHIFGHIHNEKDVYNAGILKLPNMKTTFVNASIVDYYHNFVNPGILIDIKIK